MKIMGTMFLVRKKRINSVRQTYHMFIFRHGKYTFLQLTLIGMRNFAIPGRNAHDYYRNKLTLNMAGNFLILVSKNFKGVRECWDNYLSLFFLFMSQLLYTYSSLLPAL